MKTCEGCGGRIYSHNNTGYCRKTEHCRRENVRIRNSRPYSVEARQSYRREHREVQMWHSAKHRAERKGVPFTITQDDVRAIWTDTCPVFGYELRINQAGTGAHARESYSLDRIDPAKGYVPGNIQILSQRANAMKSDATPEELLRFADWIYETYGGH